MTNQPYSYINLDEDLDLNESQPKSKTDSSIDELAELRETEGANSQKRDSLSESDNLKTRSAFDNLSANEPLNQYEAPTHLNERKSSAEMSDSMTPLEKKMLEVATEDYNDQRQKAHVEIDRVYDNMIEITGQKIKGLTKDVATEAGMD